MRKTGLARWGPLLEPLGRLAAGAAQNAAVNHANDHRITGGPIPTVMEYAELEATA
ncbi:hypothetical protein ACQP25_17855 [Microtetraspora malaysiensis]|uniref:hypothetical protein n=1 Tax=Microtetraspora malaysiensis TaxID=161358 RepID=UPI003D90FF86